MWKTRRLERLVLRESHDHGRVLTDGQKQCIAECRTKDETDI